MLWISRHRRLLLRPARVALLLAASVGPVAAAATPEPFVFANLATSHHEGSSDPYAVAACRDAVVFAAKDDAYGQELWRTDGTTRGTFLLADLCPGRCSVTINSMGPSSEPDLGFLDVRFAGGKGELWRTDCTEEGTFRLGDGAGSYIAAAWIPQRHRMVYRGRDAAGGAEPWVSDGTRVGTRRLADVVAGAGGSDPDGFRAAGGLAWFTASDPQHGRELWRSDGTRAGTLRVTDLVPGPGNGVARVLGTIGARLVFEGIDELAGLEPWSVAAGEAARRLADVTPGADGSRIEAWADDGRRAVFHVGSDFPRRTEVWVTDGTPAATRRLLETDSTYFVYGIVAAGPRTLFFHEEAAHGRELWTTDGTVAGTHLVADVCPGPCSTVHDGILFAFAGAWYFSGRSEDGSDYELWRTDGTAAGTVRVADLCPGPCGSFPIGPYPEGVLVTGFGSGTETLWRTDGTAAGTTEIASFDRVLPGGGYFGPNDSTAAGLLLTADDGLHGREPWWTDYTTAGTVPLGDLLLGVEDSSNPQGLTRFGDRFLFLASGEDGKARLWSSDGTVGGTRSVPPLPELGDLTGREVALEAGAGGVFVLVRHVDQNGNGLDEASLYWTDGDTAPRHLAVLTVGRTAFYNLRLAGDDAGLFLLGNGLWHSDGTVDGTRFLKAVFLDSRQAEGVLLAGELYFVAGLDLPFPAFELAVSDGTVAGTASFYQDPSWPNAGSSGGPHELAPDGAGGFYFVADRGEDRERIWHTDGTVAGTHVAVDLAESPQPLVLRVAGDTLFFVASGDSGLSLWASDGTLAGTVDTTAPFPTPGSTQPAGIEAVEFDGELVYVSSDSRRPRFWRSDGTRDGTVPMPDLAPTETGNELYVAYVWSVGGRLFVSAQYFGEPWKLWLRESLDGPSVLLATFADDAYAPGDFLALGSRVFFSAGDETVGRELWALDFAAPPPPEPGCVADDEHPVPRRWPLPSARRVARPAHRRFGAAGSAPFPGSDRTGSFWFFDPANVELIVKLLDGEPINGFYWTF